MTFPPYRPPDHLAAVLEQLNATKALVNAIDGLNETAEQRSQRIELAADALESLVNSVSIMAKLQRQMQADLADVAVMRYERDLNAANQTLAYNDTKRLIDLAMEQADHESAAYSTRGLFKALNFVIGLVDAIMFSIRSLKVSVIQIDALTVAVSKLRQDTAPLIEQYAERQRQIDNWFDDALKGGSDAKD